MKATSKYGAEAGLVSAKKTLDFIVFIQLYLKYTCITLFWRRRQREGYRRKLEPYIQKQRIHTKCYVRLVYRY